MAADRADASRTDVGGTVLDALRSDTTTASTGDATVPFPVPCEEALVCDDFESYAIGAVPGAPFKVAAAALPFLKVDGTKPYRGTKSVHITSAGGLTPAVLQLGKPVLPLAGNDLHGRMMLFFSALPKRTYFRIVRGGGPLPSGIVSEWAIAGNREAKLTIHSGPGEQDFFSTMDWPIGRWICLQWRFNGGLDAAGQRANEMRVWIDGAAIEELTVVGKPLASKKETPWIAPTFQSMNLGYGNHDPNAVGAVELWMDEVGIANRPIACPPAR